jgi:multicomponent Na+:H+ antiporter subunit E
VSLFAVNLLLAAAWCALLGAFSLGAFVTGFVLAYGALLVAQPLFGPAPYFSRVLRLARLSVYFLRELVLSSVKVSIDVLSPRPSFRPGIVAMPLVEMSDAERVTLASLITLTPGTLSLDFSPDRQTLYVHGMFVDDADALRRELKDGMECQVLRALA